MWSNIRSCSCRRLHRWIPVLLTYHRCLVIAIRHAAFVSDTTRWARIRAYLILELNTYNYLHTTPTLSLSLIISTIAAHRQSMPSMFNVTAGRAIAGFRLWILFCFFLLNANEEPSCIFNTVSFFYRKMTRDDACRFPRWRHTCWQHNHLTTMDQN
jgi:hypothetical protein